VSDGNDAGVSFFDYDANSSGRHWQIQNNYYAHGNLDFMMGTTNTGNPTTPVMSLTVNGYAGIGLTNPWSMVTTYGSQSNPSLTHQTYGLASFATGAQDLSVFATTNSGGTIALQGRNSTADGVSYPISLNPLGGNVGIGTTDPCDTSHSAPANCKLSVAGAIQAQEVVVNTGWSDYVFQPTYHLRPLSEVAAYIQEKHHLPDIPSEAEVKEKGVSLGEMQSKLLAKVEELTLHMIEADERNERLERENRELRDGIQEIRSALQTANIPLEKK
jgi:hypothetical protein